MTDTPPIRDLSALYAADQGIYRGCGPNGGVCHNGREYPNLASVGAILENIGQPCNQKRDAPQDLADVCERTGDVINLGDFESEIAWIAQENTSGYRLHAREPIDRAAFDQAEEIVIVRGELELWGLYDFGLSAAWSDGDLLFTGPELELVFANAGIPGDPSSIQLGDPNRNGTFGAELGGKLIAPGDPAKSYIMMRLTDPEAGPLMPRANCCGWSKASLRAMFCWIAGLRDDGSNALDPIDYDTCPSGPVEDVEYPEPGPNCETAGLCPVQPRSAVSMNQPTWENVYRVLSQNCAGTSCHVDSAAAGLDMKDEASAMRSLSENSRVVPGDPRASKLFVRISPDLCRAPSCQLMPLAAQPLAAETRALVEMWISSGAHE